MYIVGNNFGFFGLNLLKLGGKKLGAQTEHNSPILRLYSVLPINVRIYIFLKRMPSFLKYVVETPSGKPSLF